MILVLFRPMAVTNPSKAVTSQVDLTEGKYSRKECAGRLAFGSRVI
jgi:hypothetical protein